MKIGRICYLGKAGRVMLSPIGVLTPGRKSTCGIINVAVRWMLEPQQANGHYHLAIYDEGSEAFLFGKPEAQFELVKDNEIWGFVP